MLKQMTEQELKAVAPSVFSQTHREGLSARYKHISTWDVMKGLEQVGFYPVKAIETRKRSEREHARHMVRFRKEGEYGQGGMVPEIVLINSHDGLSTYQIKAGIYRVICTNGLIVGDTLLEHKIKHQGNIVDKVISSSNYIIEVMPQVLEKAKSWESKMLTQKQKEIFGGTALRLKWDTKQLEDSNITHEAVLKTRREMDKSDDLWTTFNVIQENLIRGGIPYYNHVDNTRNTTREIRSVTENNRLNTQLWNLAEHMATLV
jgi:hypothetical protein